MNKIKDLENSIIGTSPDLEKNILLEMHRISHRQFPWQNPPNSSWITRYYKIFKYPPLDKLLKEITGLNTQEIFTIGLALTGMFIKYFAITYPIEHQALGITKEKYDIFLKYFSRNLEEIRKIIIESQKYNLDYAYLINPLRFFPLIEIIYRGEKSHISPIPTFLFWRFTDGIYYEICDNPKFGNPFGESFQKYIGEVLEQTKTSTQIIYPEKEYHVGKNRKDTVDWLLLDSNCLLFIECKTKKMKSASKTSLTDTSSLEEDLDKMSDFAIQIYKQIYDFNEGHYPITLSSSVEKVFPLILTITEWYAFGDKIIKDFLDKKIIKKLSDLPEKMHEYYKTYPYTICSIDDFEKALQLIAEVGVNHFMSKKTEGECRLWAMNTYIYEFYGEQVKNLKDLFPKDFKAICSIE